MGHVAHIAALADRDPVAKPVLDRGQAVYVVAEVLYRQKLLAPEPADDLACPSVAAAEEIHCHLIDAHGDGFAAVVTVQVEIDVSLGPRLVGHRCRWQGRRFPQLARQSHEREDVGSVECGLLRECGIPRECEGGSREDAHESGDVPRPC